MTKAPFDRVRMADALPVSLVGDLSAGKLSVRQAEALFAVRGLSAPTVLAHPGEPILDGVRAKHQRELRKLTGDGTLTLSQLCGDELDPLSGALPEDELTPNLLEACALADRATHDVHLAAAEVVNVDAANAELEQSGADAVLRHMHLVFQETLSHLVAAHGGEAHFHRKPGAGMAAIVVLPRATDARLLEQALVTARERAQHYARNTKVLTGSGESKSIAELAHPRDPSQKGVGLLLATAMIERSMTPERASAAVGAKFERRGGDARGQRREAVALPAATLPEAELVVVSPCDVPLGDDAWRVLARGEPVVDHAGRERLLSRNQRRSQRARTHAAFSALPMAQQRELSTRYIERFDTLTGLGKPEHLQGVLLDGAAACARDAQHDVPSVVLYVEGDVVNLGGVNRFGRSAGNLVLQTMARLFVTEMQAACAAHQADVVFVRKGGDEVAAVIKVAQGPHGWLSETCDALERSVAAWVASHSVRGFDGALIDLPKVPATAADRPDGTSLVVGWAALEGGTIDRERALLSMRRRAVEAILLKKRQLAASR